MPAAVSEAPLPATVQKPLLGPAYEMEAQITHTYGLSEYGPAL